MIACARSANEPASRRELAVPRSALLGSSTSPCTPSTAPPVFVSAVTRWRKRNETSPRLLRLAHAAHERLDHARAGAPGDMKARHRIAVAGRQISAALGPADDRKNLQALLAQPGALLAGREIHIGLGPAARPVILLAVEAGRAEPVLQRKIARVADAHAALLGRVDEEQSAERPERLAAERSLRLLIENDDAPARVGELGGRDKTREACADHDGVCVHAVPQNTLSGDGC